MSCPPARLAWTTSISPRSGRTPGPPLSAMQRLAVACTDAMTRGIRLPGPLFEALRANLTSRQVVELITTVAAYNMVSRVVVALEIA